MIKMRDIIVESLLTESVMHPVHRISLGRIQINLEKVLPEVTKKQAKKLEKIFEEISDVATTLNAIPYTKFDHSAWVIEIELLNNKLQELQKEAQSIAKNKKIDCAPLMKALQEVLGY